MAKVSDFWLYSPSAATAVVFTTAFAAIGCVLLFRGHDQRPRRFLWLNVLAISHEVVGFAIRAVACYNLDNVDLYASTQSLIILAPLYTAGANYMMASRLLSASAVMVSGQSDANKQRVLGLRTSWITPIFVSSDILTFCIQAAGPCIAATDNWTGSLVAVGSDVILAGLGMQTATICVFITVVLRLVGRRLLVPSAQPKRAWTSGLRAVVVSSIAILVRSVFRLVEFAMGPSGYPMRFEWPFYVFEALPMVIAVGIFMLVYPPDCVSRTEDLEQVSSREDGVFEIESRPRK